MDVQTLNWPEYNAVKEFYGDRKAERSGVPLIQHIQEGLTVMECELASVAARKAYCLHPLFQNDAELTTVGLNYCLSQFEGSITPAVILMVMEYRARANAWLSDKVGLYDGEIILQGKPDYGPMEAVRLMLIADKVQNYKDFMLYHYGTHARSAELKRYFEAWFVALRVEFQVADLISHIEREYPNVR